jgi:hypothetical protein
MPEPRTFYEILKDKSPELASQLDLIKKKGLEEWVPMLQFDRGSHGGYPHLRNVERNADKLVPQKIKEKFGAGEIFLLLCSIYLHDIGKIIPDQQTSNQKDISTICKSLMTDHQTPCLQNECEECQAPVIDRNKQKIPQCRDRKHAYESERIINESWAMLGLPNEKIAKYCAMLAYCHGLNTPLKVNQCRKSQEQAGDYCEIFVEPYGLIRIPLLASIIRIADETDNYWTRSIELYWYENIQATSRTDLLVKAFRRWVEDVEFCHEGRCIIMHLPESIKEKSDCYKKTIAKLSDCREQICNVLRNWSKPLNNEDIHYDYAFLEHGNTLCLNPIEDIKFSKIFDQDVDKNSGKDTKKELERLVNAIIDLALGSLEYESFRWRSLEAKIGRLLTDRDKWFVKWLSPASKHKLNIVFIPEDEKIRITFEGKPEKDGDEYINKDYIEEICSSIGIEREM